MKERLLSTLLALCAALTLCLTALPAAAAAVDGEDLTVDSDTVTDTGTEYAQGTSINDGYAEKIMIFGDELNDAGDILGRLCGAKASEVVTLTGNYETTLTQDVDIMGGSSAEPVVLDLNGYALNVKGDGDLTVSGTLEILDGSETGGGSLQLDWNSCIHVMETGRLLLSGGTINGGSVDGGDSEETGQYDYPCAVYNTGNFIVTGGTVNGGNNAAGPNGVQHNPCAVSNASNFTLDGGTINGGDGPSTFAVYTTSIYARFTMNGGTINGGDGTSSFAVHCSYCDSVTIKGGTINGGDGDGTYAVYCDYGSAPIMDGGTINGGNGTISHAVEVNTSFTMNGGTINGGSGAASYAVYNNAGFTLDGGTINCGSVTSFHPKDYSLVQYPCAFYSTSRGSVYMSGGKIDGKQSCAFSTGYGCGLTMDGGEITSSASGEPPFAGDGENASAPPEATLVCTGGDMRLRGGTITNSGTGYALKVDNIYDFQITVLCLGTTFRAKQSDRFVIVAEKPEGKKVKGTDTMDNYMVDERPDDDGCLRFYLPETGRGSCADGLAWEYGDGILTVSGTGNMEDYSSLSSPWLSYCLRVKTVIIGDGVTGIGKYAFYDFNELTVVAIPASVTGIGERAFYKCSFLSNAGTIYYGGSEAQWSGILIGDYNDALSNASRYCGSAAPEPYAVKPTPVAGNGVRCLVTSISTGTKDVYVLAALYEESGKLREVKTEQLHLPKGDSRSAMLYFTVKPSGSDRITVFLLDPESCAPLCSPNQTVS